MKNFVIVFVLVILVGLASCLIMGNRVKGNGDLTTIEKTLPPFNKIDVRGKTEVHFHLSPDYRVEVTTDSNIQEYILTDVENQVLIIQPEKYINLSPTKELLDIYCPEISAVSLSGSSFFKADDDITTSNFKIDISGSGTINANISSESIAMDVSGSGKIISNVSCDNIAMDISGSGDVELSGASKMFKIDINGSGEMKGKNFTTDDCVVDINGSGSMTAAVNNNLEGKISGSGKIMYRGNPKITFYNSGSGKIENIE